MNIKKLLAITAISAISMFSTQSRAANVVVDFNNGTAFSGVATLINESYSFWDCPDCNGQLDGPSIMTGPTLEVSFSVPVQFLGYLMWNENNTPYSNPLYTLYLGGEEIYEGYLNTVSTGLNWIESGYAGFIDYIVIHKTSSDGVNIDNFTYAVQDQPQGEVPEPAAPLLIAGLAAIAALRQRKH